MPRRSPPTTSTAARRSASRAPGKSRLPGGPSTRPGGVPLKGRHIERAVEDVEEGRKDTERRGVPSDVPKRG